MSVQLSQLILSNIRNLAALDLQFGPQFNVFVGANGSGKTSVLEAIHLLSAGRSFRARTIRQVIAFDADQLLIRARLSSPVDQPDTDVWLGFEKTADGGTQYRVGEQAEKSVAELTRLLPVQLIDVNSHLLIEGGPIYRRQFLDWGVFHVEHNFLSTWRLMQRALEQRNAALKQRQNPDAAWTAAFVKYAVLVDEMRINYLQQFKPLALNLLRDMLGWNNIDLIYKRGWSDNYDLSTALDDSRIQDLSLGYTNRGPQRAELEFLIDGRPAKAVLSRGQMKIFVCILLLARAHLLQSLRSSVFLVDDLHAELDKHSCGLFIEAIAALGCQVFITGIEADLLQQRLLGRNSQVFHVEHGWVVEK